ncbi:MAG: hypothetical protein MJ099_04360, partial [Clostridia bacterium]|nr:hypothetical protein [Clostridia bacterium]
KSSLFAYAERFGFESLNDRSRMCDIREATSLREASASRYAFMPEKTTIQQARATFNEHNEKNKRLNAIFITTDGTSSGRLLAMLTPWDVLKHSVSRED